MIIRLAELILILLATGVVLVIGRVALRALARVNRRLREHRIALQAHRECAHLDDEYERLLNR